MARRALGTESRLVLRRGSRYEPPARPGERRTLEDMSEDTSPWTPPAPAVDDVPDAAVGKRAEGVSSAAVATAPVPTGEVTAPAGAADAVPQPPPGPTGVPSVGRSAAFHPGPVPPVPAVTPAEGVTAPGGDEETASPGDHASETAVAAPSPGESGSPSRHAGVRGEEPEHARSPHADTRPSRAGWPPPSSTAAPGAPVAGRSGTVGAGAHGVREPDLGQAPGTTPPTSPDAPGTHGVPRDADRPPAASGSPAPQEGRGQAGRTGPGVDAGSSARRPSRSRSPGSATGTEDTALLNAVGPEAAPPPAAPPAAADDHGREQPAARTDRSPGTAAPVAPPPDGPSPRSRPVRRPARPSPVPQAPRPEPVSATAPPRGEDTGPAGSPGRPASLPGHERSRKHVQAGHPSPGRAPHRAEAGRTGAAPSADTRTDPFREHRPQHQGRAGADARSPQPTRPGASPPAFPDSPAPAGAGTPQRPEPAPSGPRKRHPGPQTPDTVELVRDHVVPVLTGRGVLPPSAPVEVRTAEAGEPAPAPRAGTATVRTTAARRTPSAYDDASGTPAVHLHIARIEVLPPAPPPAPAAPAPVRPAPRVDLDAYLARRDKENR